MTVAFVIGWRTKEKVIGPAYPGYCEHCRNYPMWYLTKRRLWGNLLLVPVLPVGPKTYELRCEICGEAIELHGENVERAKGLVSLTEKHESGKLDEEEYNREVGQIVDELRDSDGQNVETSERVEEFGEQQ